MVTTDNKAEETHDLELIQTIHAGFEANNKYGVFAKPSRNQNLSQNTGRQTEPNDSLVEKGE